MCATGRQNLQQAIKKSLPSRSDFFLPKVFFLAIIQVLKRRARAFSRKKRLPHANMAGSLPKKLIKSAFLRYLLRINSTRRFFQLLSLSCQSTTSSVPPFPTVESLSAFMPRSTRYFFTYSARA